MNRYRVVPNWEEVIIRKNEVIVEADYFKSSSFEGKAVTEFYSEGKKKNSDDDELLAIFWGEVIVIKMPCE